MLHLSGRAALGRRAVAAFLVIAVLPLLASAEPAKNVILLVADGAGFNTWVATSLYEGKLGKQPFDGEGWVRLAMSTYPLTRSAKPTGKGEQDPAVVYDPAKAWSDLEWQRKTPTDSAAAGTALACGQKTYDNAINWSDLDKPLLSIAEIAKRTGRCAGSITSVTWSHATPATLGGAHNPSRGAYAEIANEMLAAKTLDVVMGAGHPDYTNDAKARAPAADEDPLKRKARYQAVGGEETWTKLHDAAQPLGWKCVESAEDFEALTRGDPRGRYLGTARAATTLQEKRSGGDKTDKPGAVAPNTGVPDLATMTKAALNILDSNPDGFYLMVEGGAVDWANHDNRGARMIEEMSDYYRAVRAVCDYLDANTAGNNWTNTLVILTADHETGFIWGAEDMAAHPFQPLADAGKGAMPTFFYHSGNHTNSLVPLYARGPGSEYFRTAKPGGEDAKAAEVWSVPAKYLDNTDVFRAMQAALQHQPAALPVGAGK